MENGDRADRVGSNPHSKGDNFSRFLMVVRIAVKYDTTYTITGSIAAIDDERVMCCIN